MVADGDDNSWDELAAQIQRADREISRHGQALLARSDSAEDDSGQRPGDSDTGRVAALEGALEESSLALMEARESMLRMQGKAEQALADADARTVGLEEALAAATGELAASEQARAAVEDDGLGPAGAVKRP
jgi:hypothetical protein